MSAWGGIASAQFGLPIMWTEAKRRSIPVRSLLQWMVERPLHRLGLHQTKGQLVEGFDADMVVWNPDAEIEVCVGVGVCVCMCVSVCV